MGIEGTGLPTVSMRLGKDADRQNAKQFNEAMNQAAEADDASATTPQPKSAGGWPTTQSLVTSPKFTDEQINGGTDADSKRIDQQSAEDRKNSLQQAPGPLPFPEAGPEGYAVHAESPPKGGIGVGTCNVSASELNRRGIIRDPFGIGVDMRLVRSADTGAVHLEPFDPNKGYYDVPARGSFDIKNQKFSPPSVSQQPSMSPASRNAPIIPFRPGSAEEINARMGAIKGGVGANAPLLIVSEIFGGNSQAIIENSVAANGLISAMGSPYQAKAQQPTPTPYRPTVSTDKSWLEGKAPTSQSTPSGGSNSRAVSGVVNGRSPNVAPQAPAQAEPTVVVHRSAYDLKSGPAGKWEALGLDMAKTSVVARASDGMGADFKVVAPARPGGTSRTSAPSSQGQEPVKRNVYPDFEPLKPQLQQIAREQTAELSKQVKFNIPENRVLEAPWIGKVRSSASTSEGWLRNESRFWSEWKRQFPDDAKLLGPNQTVTKELAEKYEWPTSGPTNVVGQKLVHHHLNNSSLTVALPENVHKKLYGEIHRPAQTVGRP